MREGRLDNVTLLRLYLELRCIGLVGDRLVRIDGAEPGAIPRYFVGQLIDGDYVAACHHNLSAAVRTRLATAPPAVALTDHRLVCAILVAEAPCERASAGKQYVIPELHPTDDPDIERLLPPPQELLDDYDPSLQSIVARRPAFVIRSAGQVLAYCMAGREKATASETWVRTLPQFRSRGLASRVTAAWAYDVQQQGKVALYGHALDNLASQGVARRLGLMQYLTEAWYY